MESKQPIVNEETECCPKFEPERWDEKTLEWKNKKFVKGSVCTFMYMPLNFGAVMRKLDTKIRNSGASMQQDGMGLSDHTSAWKMDVCLAVDREVAGLNNVTFSGKFLCKVYEGDFRETGKWTKTIGIMPKVKTLKSKKCTCGILHAPSVPKNTAKTMLQF